MHMCSVYIFWFGAGVARDYRGICMQQSDAISLSFEVCYAR